MIDKVRIKFVKDGEELEFTMEELEDLYKIMRKISGLFAPEYTPTIVPYSGGSIGIPAGNTFYTTPTVPPTLPEVWCTGGGGSAGNAGHATFSNVGGKLT